MVKAASEGASPPKEDYPYFNSEEWVKTEVRELGDRLPLGLWLDGELLQDYTVRKLTAKDRRKIDAIAKASENNPIKVLQALTGFIPEIVETLGGYSIAEIEKKSGKKINRLLFENMYYGDLTALLFNARLKSIGPDIALAFKCTNCGAENKDSEESGYHDIGTAEVNVYEGEPLSGPYEYRYDLDAPSIMGGEAINYLVFRPLTTADIAYILSPKTSHGRATASIMRMTAAVPESTLYSKKTVPGTVMDTRLHDSIDYDEIGRITQFTLRLQDVGLSLSVTEECVACGTENQIVWPWIDLATFLDKPISL